ncbi:hypothetical protein OG780_24825 [Streptomyces sp. NBC_00386]|jgi:hypothetical protein|uniref:hypothetical protein n=1 Tax=Streptomyces sp. NBC_00386 TaxID=2975734 RepID=UPI002E1C5EDD
MYGHDGAPPTRSAGTVITLRVLFAAAGLLSCGLLACVPLFRVAIQRGRWFDWTAAWVSLPVSIGALMVVGTVPESDSRGDVALTVALILGAGSVAYYLASDIRFHNAGRRPVGYAPLHPRTAPGPYGHPQPAPPAAPYPGFHVPQPPVPQPYPPNTPMPQPPPQRATPARIDQVRAELDELSDYLRRHGDRRDGDHEGGR